MQASHNKLIKEKNERMSNKQDMRLSELKKNKKNKG
jgi:hypothetical protein